jgi:hypothetical protein
MYCQQTIDVLRADCIYLISGRPWQNAAGDRGDTSGALAQQALLSWGRAQLDLRLVLLRILGGGVRCPGHCR